MLVILLSLKRLELLTNGIATHFQVPPLFSMRTVLLASLQSCRSVDPDAWCKQALKWELTHRLTGDCSCTELKPLSSQMDASSLTILLFFTISSWIDSDGYSTQCATYSIPSSNPTKCFKKYVDQTGSVSILATKRSAVSHQRWIWWIYCAQATIPTSEGSTLALKPRADITRSQNM